MTASWLGRRLELEIGAVAHGGHFLARHEGRVVFVRHALTGERVLAVVTEDNGGSFCRADAVQVLAGDGDRVGPPCEHAHPGGCGGCDFQHITLARQRILKAQVVAEQFRRLANLEIDVRVEPLPDANGNADEKGDSESGLGWRRRVRYATDRSGRTGLRAHRSHVVIPIGRCPTAVDVVGDVAAAEAHTEPNTEIELACGDDGELAVVLHRPAPQRGRPATRNNRLARRHGRSTPRTREIAVVGPQTLDYHVADRRFAVRAGGFWQTHPAAAAQFCSVLDRELAVRPGENALDLYAGAGLFTALLAVGVGAAGRVTGLESDRGAAADGAANLTDLPQAELRHASVTAAQLAELGADLGHVDVVVLDPPRSGAKREVVNAIIDLRPRVVAYVACDPAALARDVSIAAERGWRMDGLFAYDAFPMTHHLECVAILRPGA